MNEKRLELGQVPVPGGQSRRRYNWCPRCRELWVAAWMADMSLRTCPSCEGPVFGYVGRTPYDDHAGETRQENAASA
jgi:hypothetical protein